MPYTYEQAESAILGGKARAAQWFSRFQAGYFANVIAAEVLIRWNTLPAEVKAEMKKINPEGYAEVERKMKALMEQRHAD